MNYLGSRWVRLPLQITFSNLGYMTHKLYVMLHNWDGQGNSKTVILEIILA
jgi:hypothetical protein